MGVTMGVERACKLVRSEKEKAHPKFFLISPWKGKVWNKSRILCGIIQGMELGISSLWCL